MAESLGEGPEEPWRWASMVWGPRGDRDRAVRFHADENGNYELVGIPSGWSTVRVSIMMTPDVEGGTSRDVYLSPGAVAEVNFFGKEPLARIRLRFEVGGKTPEDEDIHVDARVEPLSPNRGPYPDFADMDLVHRPFVRGGILTLEGLAPGRYHLWLKATVKSLGLSGALIFKDDVVASREPEEILLQLGSCRITGEFRECNEVLRQPLVVAIPHERSMPIRRTRIWSGTQAFSLRHLAPGKYDIVCHDWNGGFCRVADVDVDSPDVDIGEHLQQRGIDIAGVLPDLGAVRVDALEVVGEDRFRAQENYKRLRPPDGSVAGRNREGVVSPIPGAERDGKFVLGNLWPGVWKVRALAAGEVVAEGEVVVPAGVECVEVELRPTGRPAGR